MTWQNMVFAVGSFLLALALVPSVLRRENKPAPSTSLLTGGIVAVYAVTFASMRFWASVVASVCASSLWFVLLVQALRGRSSHPSG